MGRGAAPLSRDFREEDGVRAPAGGYERAAAGFPVRFERVVLDEGLVPAHVFRRRRAAVRSLLVLSGGVDTWKVELHRLAVGIARVTGMTVAAIDMVDTTTFASRREATVWVVRDATHCAAERIQRVIPASLGGLNAQLHDGALVHRAAPAPD